MSQEQGVAKTPLFIVIAILAFAALVMSFPFVQKHVLSFPFHDYGSTSKGLFYLVLWIGAFVIGAFIYYLIFSWVFRWSAGMTPLINIRQAVLLIGALFCGGYLLYNLWKGFNPNSRSLLIQRVALSGLIIAICGSAVDAIRRGPSAVYDRSAYRA
jgi:glucan phosphoethanolaminetransferase (alkaline phosphatase superfamily)